MSEQEVFAKIASLLSERFDIDQDQITLVKKFTMKNLLKFKPLVKQSLTLLKIKNKLINKSCLGFEDACHGHIFRRD